MQFNVRLNQLLCPHLRGGIKICPCPSIHLSVHLSVHPSVHNYISGGIRVLWTHFQLFIILQFSRLSDIQALYITDRKTPFVLRYSFNLNHCSEIGACFQKLSDDSDCRVVVLSGAGKIFTAGLVYLYTYLHSGQALYCWLTNFKFSM